MVAAAGPAMEGLRASGRRYASLIRSLTVGPVVAVAFAVGFGHTTIGLVPVLVALLGWSGWYAWAVRRRHGVLLPLVDTLVLASVGLSSMWLVPVSWLATGKSWLIPFVAFAGVGYQYSCTRVTGLVCAFGLLILTGVGTVLALPPGASASSVVSTVWSALIAVLAAILWRLIERGGSRADDALSDLDEAAHDHEVAAMLRQDQRAIAAALHDTAASTLLMIGLGEVPDGTALATRAGRDLEVIRTFGVDASEREAPLVPALIAASERHGINVSFETDVAPLVPPRALHAFVGAVTEALNNVERHAGTAIAVVAVDTRENCIRVRVSDRGSGFDSTTSSTQRGIRYSILERMTAAGGTAALRSQQGAGTTVELEWSS